MAFGGCVSSMMFAIAALAAVHEPVPYVDVEPPKAAEVYKVKCDVHPWMGAYFAVFNHPYFAATGEDGTFDIKDVPDGTYDVTIWQEKLGEQDAGKVTVKGGKGELNFAMKPAEEADASPASNVKVLTLSALGGSGEACCENEKTVAPAVAKK